jgi:hypothetical protein
MICPTTLQSEHMNVSVSMNLQAKYIWNIMMIGTNIFRISPCHVRMTWDIFCHMYMDESHKMDEKFG